MKADIQLFGKTRDGEDIHLVTLHNKQGSSIQVSTHGARIVSIKVPDRNGKLDEVTLGYNNSDSYINGCEYLGATIGRFANRICWGRFPINGRAVELNPNNNNHHLHGGRKGFSSQNWKLSDISGRTVTLYYLSADGEENYPGNLKVFVTYEWTDENELIISHRATTDKDTIINLTNHAYFNLNGEGQENIHNHSLQIDSKQILDLL